jgi:hypothetical protein
MGRERVRRLESAARPGRADMETRFGSVQQVSYDSYDLILLSYDLVSAVSSTGRTLTLMDQ